MEIKLANLNRLPEKSGVGVGGSTALSLRSLLSGFGSFGGFVGATLAQPNGRRGNLNGEPLAGERSTLRRQQAQQVQYKPPSLA